MNKYLVLVLLGALFVGVSVLSPSFLGASIFSSIEQTPTLTATVASDTPAAQSIPAGAQNVDVARITLAASGGDVFLNGIELGTDVAEGLSNFTDIKIYDVYGTGSGPVLKGTAPNQSVNPYLVQFSNVTIGNGMSKTYLIRAGLSSSAAGTVRIGFNGFTFSTQATPTLSGIPVYGNAMTLPGATPTPVTTSSSTPSPSATSTPISGGFTNLAALNLREGEVISAAHSTDPDIYIPNEWGYKRLFLNPVIFSFYGHLGGFTNVKDISVSTRDILKTSGLFKNCETKDAKVYGLEVTGEDAGLLHWINTSGAQAVQDDPEFFKKVFCINSREFNWYAKGSDYTSVAQVPSYSR